MRTSIFGSRLDNDGAYIHISAVGRVEIDAHSVLVGDKFLGTWIFAPTIEGFKHLDVETR